MMVLKNAKRQQVLRMRRQLVYAIERNGVKVTVFTPVFENDSMNGKIPIGQKECCFEGVLINASNGSLNDMSMTDSHRKYNGTHTFIMLYDPCLDLEYLTIFVTKDNRRYRVVKVENIDNFDLVYNVYLEYTNENMKGYNANGKK